MIVAGIASGATAVAVNWGYLKAQVQSALASLTALISRASVVIGVALILMGQIPLGLYVPARRCSRRHGFKCTVE